MQHTSRDKRAADQSKTRSKSFLNSIKQNHEALIILATGILGFFAGAYRGGLSTTEAQVVVFGTFYIGVALGILITKH